ncbi:MAG: hypothetical protein B7Z05_08305 [Thiotrichales bacterium 32-46-8]|nr:MAG: hypothetical protein B7Z05_08305 [Thiotrichales bacterium 32-46-8]
MKKDLNYLSKLQDYYRDHRALPSYATMAEVLGLASKSAVHALIKRLVQAGYVSITPDRRVAPDDKFFERAMATSVVRAGVPGIADNDIVDGMAVDRYLIHNAASTLKTLIKEQGVWALQPENSAYEVIRPEGEWRVVGVLVGLMRKYR